MSKIEFRTYGDPVYSKQEHSLFLPAAPPEPSAVDRLAAVACPHAAARVREQTQAREDFLGRISRIAAPFKNIAPVMADDL